MSGSQALAAALGPDPDDPVVSELYDRQRDLDGFRTAVIAAQYDRNRAIRDAVHEGVPREKVVEITGLSRGRISQIVHYR